MLVRNGRSTSGNSLILVTWDREGTVLVEVESEEDLHKHERSFDLHSISSILNGCLHLLLDGSGLWRYHLLEHSDVYTLYQGGNEP